MKTFIQKWGVTLYILLLSAHLYAQVLGTPYRNVQIVTKLLLLPLLMLFLAMQDDFANAPKGKWLLIVGLFGSFLGDAFLLSNDYFIPGMIAFMTTHIFNIIFFNGVHNVRQPKTKKGISYLILLLAFCVFIFFQLKDAMGSLIYPILIYMLLICSAALMAIQAGGNVKAQIISKLFWFPGMLFFITSDTVLAFNKFSWEKTGPHIANIGLVTMLTYGIAQLLLVKGFQLYFKQESIVNQDVKAS
jgi:uncharacterized membrane protein YhhN